MNRERLTALRDYLSRGIIQNFDTGFIMDGDCCGEGPLEFMLRACNPGSGCTVCAIGLFPWVFPISFCFVSMIDRWGTPKLHLRRSDDYEIGPMESTKEFLELEWNDWFHLFGSGAYRGDDMTNPLAVAQKITNFLNKDIS